MDGVRPYYRTSHLTTAGLLRLHIADACIQQACTERLSLYDATVTHTFQAARLHAGQSETVSVPFEVKAFCSRMENVLVVRIAAGTPETPESLRAVSAMLSRQDHPVLPAAESEIADQDMVVKQQLLKGDGYVMAARILGQPCTSETVRSGVWSHVEGDEPGPLTVLLTIVSGADAEDPSAEARRRLDAAAGKGYEALLAEHRLWWEEFWRRSFVAVDDSATEKWWYVSNYLAGSMLQPGKLSPGLQGLWLKENVPAWNADFHANINIQSDYWGLLGSNRLDLMEPYFSLYTGMLEQCRKDTEEYFGMLGVRFPHAADPDGHELTDQSWMVLATHVAPTGWIAQLFWQYYQYTLDRDFLRKVAYPILRETATFYADFLRFDPDVGQYVVEPSISFEALCPGFAAMGRNSTYELAIIRKTFEMALEAADILDATEEAVELWQERLGKLAPFPVTPDGTWASWEGRGPNDSGHGQTVPFITPIFPCDLVSALHGSADLREQAAATWLDHISRQRTKPRDVGLGSSFCWCGGAPVATAAAMGDADAAISGARWPSSNTLENGLVGGWNTIYLQADHGPGMALALNSMLLQCPGGTLYLFPAFPKGIDAAFHSLRVPGALLVSSEQRDGKVPYVILQSLATTKARVASPFEPTPDPTETHATVDVRVRDLQTKKAVAREHLRYHEHIEWTTEPGRIYVLENADKPLEECPKITVAAEE